MRDSYWLYNSLGFYRFHSRRVESDIMTTVDDNSADADIRAKPECTKHTRCDAMMY